MVIFLNINSVKYCTIPDQKYNPEHFYTGFVVNTV